MTADKPIVLLLMVNVSQGEKRIYQHKGKRFTGQNVPVILSERNIVLQTI